MSNPNPQHWSVALQKHASTNDRPVWYWMPTNVDEVCGSIQMSLVRFRSSFTLIGGTQLMALLTPASGTDSPEWGRWRKYVGEYRSFLAHHLCGLDFPCTLICGIQVLATMIHQLWTEGFVDRDAVTGANSTVLSHAINAFWIKTPHWCLTHKLRHCCYLHPPPRNPY